MKEEASAASLLERLHEHEFTAPTFLDGEHSPYVSEILWVKKEQHLAVFVSLKGENTAKGDAHSFGELTQVAPSVHLYVSSDGTEEAGAWEALKCRDMPQSILDSNVRDLFSLLYCDLEGLEPAHFVLDKELAVKVAGRAFAVSAVSGAAGAFRTASRSLLETAAPPAGGVPTMSVCSANLNGEHAKNFVPFASEVLAYYKVAGMSHVYWILGNKEVYDHLSSLFTKQIAEGFLSLVLYEHPGLKLNTIEAGKAFQNNMCLYNAKNFDDLMMINDFDEVLMVDKAKTKPSLPAAIQAALTARGGETVADLCYVAVCPRVMFPTAAERARTERLSAPGATLANASATTPSLSSAYPTMDAGIPGHDIPPQLVPHPQCGSKFAELYRKSMAVVANTFFTALHETGSCKLTDFRVVQEQMPQVGTAAMLADLGLVNRTEQREMAGDHVPGEYLYLRREEDGVHVEHYAQMFANRRFEQPDGLQGAAVFHTPHAAEKSMYADQWAQAVAEELRREHPGSQVGLLELPSPLFDLIQNSVEVS